MMGGEPDSIPANGSGPDSIAASGSEPDSIQAPGSEPDSVAAPGGESNPIRDAIVEAIDEHRVILFMKGTPDAPACGFSARTVAMLQALDAPFAAIDVLPDPRIRQELSAISNWPTIPQLFVGGELIGGCDIVIEMYESGELAQALL
jgi:monothiol glutaredoxin